MQEGPLYDLDQSSSPSVAYGVGDARTESSWSIVEANLILGEDDHADRI